MIAAYDARALVRSHPCVHHLNSSEGGCRCVDLVVRWSARGWVSKRMSKNLLRAPSDASTRHVLAHFWQRRRQLAPAEATNRSAGNTRRRSRGPHSRHCTLCNIRSLHKAAPALANDAPAMVVAARGAKRRNSTPLTDSKRQSCDDPARYSKPPAACSRPRGQVSGERRGRYQGLRLL